MLYENQDDDEIEMSSDLIIPFESIKDELIEKYPNGKSLQDNLLAVDGTEWRIDLYPNGHNSKSDKRLSLGLTLVNSKLGRPCHAECVYQVINLDKQKTYSTNISRRLFQLDTTEFDSTFSGSILNETDCNVLILIEIIQFKYETSNICHSVEKKSSRMTTATTILNISNIHFISESILKLLNLNKKKK